MVTSVLPRAVIWKLRMLSVGMAVEPGYHERSSSYFQPPTATRRPVESVTHSSQRVPYLTPATATSVWVPQLRLRNLTSALTFVTALRPNTIAQRNGCVSTATGGLVGPAPGPETSASTPAPAATPPRITTDAAAASSM